MPAPFLERLVKLAVPGLSAVVREVVAEVLDALQ